MPSTTHDYVFAGLTLAATLTLPELALAAPTCAPRYRLGESAGSLFPRDPVAARHDWVDAAGNLTLAGMRRGDMYFLRIPGLADACLDADNGAVTVWRDPAASEAALRHALIDQFLPRFIAGDGVLMLHAAGVIDSGARALLLLGETGYGKSTLTAALARAGARLLNDDCMRVDVDAGRAHTIPSYPGMRLRPDSLLALYGDDLPKTSPVAEYMDKRRVALRAQDGDAAATQDVDARARVEVGAIVVLQPPRNATDIAVNRIASADACMAVVKNSFALDPSDMTWVRAQLARAAALANAVPAYSIAYPREYDRLPEVIARLRELVA